MKFDFTEAQFNDFLNRAIVGNAKLLLNGWSYEEVIVASCFYQAIMELILMGDEIITSDGKVICEKVLN